MRIESVRSRPLAAGTMLAAAGFAWWLTAVRMAGMDPSPGTGLGTVGWFTGAWVVMMAAMMLPGLSPAVAAYAVHRPRVSRWLLFTGGYLLAWSAAGLAAYGLFELGRDLLGAQLAWRNGGRWVSVGVLALAAGYQLTPLKDACLARCRKPPSPIGRGLPGALSSGIRAAGWCIGCTSGLMAALFALGVMSLTWMALIALLVALEKTGPWQRAGKAVTATILTTLALGILVEPSHVPGLVIPNSSEAMHAMKAMH